MRIIAEWRQEDYENGKKDGIGMEKENTVKNMLLKKYPIEEIMEITQLNLKSINNIKAGLGKWE